jgi:hypothetical protein
MAMIYAADEVYPDPADYADTDPICNICDREVEDVSEDGTCEACEEYYSKPDPNEDVYAGPTFLEYED